VDRARGGRVHEGVWDEKSHSGQIYNMDETPFNPSADGGKVVTVKGLIPRRITGVYKEFFTGTICVGGGGSVPSPGLIMYSANVQAAWYPLRVGPYAKVFIAANDSYNMKEGPFGAWLKRLHEELHLKLNFRSCCSWTTTALTSLNQTSVWPKD